MKKLLFVLLTLSTLFSCGGDDPLNVEPADKIDPEQPEQPAEPDKPDIKTKQIKSMTVYYPGDDYLIEQTLSYDTKRRISKIETYISDSYRDNLTTSISYDNNQITCITENICKHSNPTDLNCDNGGGIPILIMYLIQ